MRLLITIAVVLAGSLFATIGIGAPDHTTLLPLVVQGKIHSTPTETPAPDTSKPILYTEQHFDNTGSPICELMYTDDLGWVEVCSYSYDAVTSDDIVRVAFCIDHPPFGGCTLPNAERIEDGMVYWNRIGIPGPQLLTFRTDTAAGDSTEYTLKEICVGDCNW